MGRAPCCEKVGLKKGRWTAEEDEILLKYIQANGEGSWRSLPKNAGTILLSLVFFVGVITEELITLSFCGGPCIICFQF